MRELPMSRSARRVLVLGMACAAVAALPTARPAQAIIAILIGLRQGPAGVTRGTEAVLGVYASPRHSSVSSIRAVNTITDGTSNTVLVQESQR